MTSPKQLLQFAYQPKERAAAKAVGLTQYFTNRPCKNGHIDFRSTSSGACISCSKIIQKRHRDNLFKENPNFYKENYAKNPEMHKKRSAKYRMANPEKVKELNKRSKQNKREKYSALERERQASKIGATPKWLTSDHKIQIEKIYLMAKKTSNMAGFLCHVDHIVPLKGKDVCGLHVPWNLRVVSQSYNSKKSNKLDEGIFFNSAPNFGVLIHSSALPWNWRK